jgi:cytochrome c553
MEPVMVRFTVGCPPRHGRAPAIGVVLSAAALIAAAPPPDGQRIVEQGSAGGAPPCISCHGAKLEGSPEVKAPAIAGRPAAFIIARLGHYAGPFGHNPLMRQVASALSSDERKAVALYISGLPAQAPGRAPHPG